MSAPQDRVSDHSLIGPYLVDALTDEERREFEDHLDRCSRCTAEVADLGEGLVELAGQLATPPPPSLRVSVLAAIQGVAQEPALETRPAPVESAPVVSVVPTNAPPAAVSSSSTSTSTEHGIGSGDWTVAPSAPVDELALRRSRRLARTLSLAVAAVAVVALALGGWVFNLNQQRDRQISAERIAQQQAQAEQQRETDLFAAADAQVYTASVNGGRASFVVSKARNEALFIGTNLPSPGADKVYQLWTVQAAPLVDNSVNGSGTVRQWFRGPVDDSAALAVNIEPASGPPAADKPSGEILAAVNL